jgi:predicted rRNA methylase YqxC with S4 and FtsJ domains
MQDRYVKLTLRVTICVLAVAFFSCSHKRKDFEAAKTAVAQELRSPDTARFCTVDQAEFSAKDVMRTVKLWVDNRNLAGVLVRTHFEVTIDSKSGLVKAATCLECAAEDEKQKLNEAIAQLQELTSPTKASPSPAP